MNRQGEIIENQGPEAIDLSVIVHDFFRIVRRKWLYLLLAAVLLSGGLTFWRYYQYVPAYKASATYAISTYQNGGSSSYQDSSLARQLAETSPYILTSDVFLRRVAEELDTQYVQGNIQAEVMEDTNFLTISVLDTDPRRAYETLQAVQKVYPDVSESIIGKIYMEAMDETGIPSKPFNPQNCKADAVEGAVKGLLLGALIAVIQAFTNGTVRREEDCIQRINVKCLGTVPRIQRKARSKETEYHLNVQKRNADPELVEAFRNIRNKIERLAGEKNYKVLLITSALPGEGKSTVAVNTALSLAQAGRKVVLVDCDLRNPSDGAILEVPEGPGLVDYLSGSVPLSDCMVSGGTLFGYRAPCAFVRGGKPVADGAAFLSSGQMKQLLEEVSPQADYVILDTPPVGLMTDAGILAHYAQGIIFVVKEDFAKVDKILEAMEHVSQSNAEMLGCILNDDN